MTTFLASVNLDPASGVPEDTVQNNFAINGATIGDVVAAADPALQDFYNTAAPGATHALCFYLSNDLGRAFNGASIKYYDLTGHMDGSPHGSPVHETFWTLNPGGGGVAFPQEVACCLSFHGDTASVLEVGGVNLAIPSDDAAIDEGAPTTHAGRDKPRARRRGRVFIGPLYDSSSGSVATNVRPDALFKGDLAFAGAKLLADLTPNWVVWSRRDAGFHIVTGGWVDDAFDTQRRRGVDTLSRVLWP